jgi:hypothetical protein
MVIFPPLKLVKVAKGISLDALELWFGVPEIVTVSK